MGRKKRDKESNPRALDSALAAIAREIAVPRDQSVASRIAFSGVHPGDGATFLGYASGLYLARRYGFRVLLVDCDGEPEGMSRYLGGEATPGLADYLAAKASFAEVVQPLEEQGIFFAPAGEKLLATAFRARLQGIREFADEASSHFDVVLFDVRPLSVVIDPVLMSNAIDGLFLVVRPRKILRSEAEEYRELLRAHGIRLRGVLVNR